MAIGISISGSLDQHVREYLEHNQEKVAALLLLSTDQRLQEAGDLVALAQQVKKAAQTLIDHWHATKIFIFYRGPASGACFIGHQLNAINSKIQIMENLNSTYIPSFLLQ